MAHALYVAATRVPVVALCLHASTLLITCPHRTWPSWPAATPAAPAAATGPWRRKHGKARKLHDEKYRVVRNAGHTFPTLGRGCSPG